MNFPQEFVSSRVIPRRPRFNYEIREIRDLPTQQFNFDCVSVPGSVSFRIFRTVKNIRVHPAPSVAKNCGTIALPGRRVPDVSRTGIRRVRPSRSPGKMRRRTAGRVQGVKHTPTPCRIDGRARHWPTRLAPSNLNSPTINHPEQTGVIRSVLQKSLRITPGRLTSIRSEPDSTGLNRSHPEFHRQIQILCRARLSPLTLCSVDFLAFLLNPMAFFALYFRQAYKRDNLGVHESNPSYGSRRCEASPAAALKLSKGF
jgi:hypothetical protein